MSAGRTRIDNTSIVEGNSGSKVMIFTVTRAGATDRFGVNYAAMDGNAMAAGVILDDEGLTGAGTVSINDAKIVEGNSGTRTLTFNV